MMDLLYAYEASMDIAEVLTGERFFVTGRSGALGNLGRIFNVIVSYASSSITELGEDESISVISGIVEDKSLSISDKADRILGCNREYSTYK